MQVSWQKESQFNVITDGNFELNIDAEGAVAPCPTDILLSALGTCSATDVVDGLQKEGVELIRLNNHLTYTLTESSPKLYKTVNLHFVVKAEQVTAEQVSRLATEAVSKYCHVCLMLQPKISISHSVEIL